MHIDMCTCQQLGCSNTNIVYLLNMHSIKPPSLLRLCYKSWPAPSGCPSYCCCMWTIDSNCGPEVALLTPTHESHMQVRMHYILPHRQMNTCHSVILLSRLAWFLSFFVFQLFLLACSQSVLPSNFNLTAIWKLTLGDQSVIIRRDQVM